MVWWRTRFPGCVELDGGDKKGEGILVLKPGQWCQQKGKIRYHNKEIQYQDAKYLQVVVPGSVVERRHLETRCWLCFMFLLYSRWQNGETWSFCWFCLMAWTDLIFVKMVQLSCAAKWGRFKEKLKHKSCHCRHISLQLSVSLTFLPKTEYHCRPSQKFLTLIFTTAFIIGSPWHPSELS